MSRLRNPFKIRASEKIVSDTSFIDMFSHSILLDLLINQFNKSILWNNVTYIRSSPGGGKTTLLRLFEPTVLNILNNNPSSNKDLYEDLKKIDVINKNGINTLGIYLLCSKSFEFLEDIQNSESFKKRLFYSLLNSRIILATLKSILIFKNKRFPDDLELIQYKYDNNKHYFTDINTPCTGKELYNWAAKFEKNIFKLLDSLVPPSEHFETNVDLFAFEVISPEYFTFENEKICDRFLFMLDDAHILTKTQRLSIQESLIEKRGIYNLWIAERTEALSPDCIIENRNKFERDFQEISLEKMDSIKESKKNELFGTIAHKRAILSQDNISSFQNNLESVRNESKYTNNYQKSIDESIAILNEIRKINNKYNIWINYPESIEELGISEKAILYKQIEILINRDSNKSQMELYFEPKSVDLLCQNLDDVKSAAIYFVCKNYKIPYYFGFSQLVRISSSNIEQFLHFSSELFERMLSKKLLGNSYELDAGEQDRIIKDIALEKWKLLQNNIPNSKMVINFLLKLGAFCREQSEQKNAPYPPGVNGFGIKESSKNLFNEPDWFLNSSFEPLVKTISTCVAFNLLEIKETLQGSKGQKWDVFYLNRWLCVYFELPLNYGNWRSKSVGELFKWIK